MHVTSFPRSFACLSDNEEGNQILIDEARDDPTNALTLACVAKKVLQSYSPLVPPAAYERLTNAAKEISDDQVSAWARALQSDHENMTLKRRSCFMHPHLTGG